ncbi:MAG: hypothetical protein DI549_10820 [Ancylobacter novellus]|uniref:DUF2190 family protein n=1 Tax=Ancylobacter novellus TaxID=921 RepID=A0A2W5R6Y9_ANCNO|nr:MAG: hypothetical protein DI549_10820 [Ancylobacter novellus]
MQNYVQAGDTLSLLAPYAVISGAGAQVGQIFGVAVGDAANGAEVELKTKGVFELTKLSAQAWTVGALVYWDNTNKRCTTVATGNLLIGAATAIAANPSATGIVRLNGVASAASA